MKATDSKTLKFVAKLLAGDIKDSAGDPRCYWVNTDPGHVVPKGLPNDAPFSRTKPKQPYTATILIETESWLFVFPRNTSKMLVFGWAIERDTLREVLDDYTESGCSAIGVLEEGIFKGLYTNPTMEELRAANVVCYTVGALEHGQMHSEFNSSQELWTPNYYEILEGVQ